MIVYKKNLNRFYDTKTKKIVSQAKAFRYALKHGKHSVDVAKGKARKSSKKQSKRVAKKNGKYARPSYKKLYKRAVKQLQKLENQYSADHRFHPFIANQTKHGYISPETNVRDVKAWLDHHTGKLFVVAALGDDDHYIVRACGSVDDLKAAGFAARDLVPELADKFSKGYNDN